MSEITMEVNIIPTKATHQSSLRIMKSKSGRMFVGKFAKSAIKSWITEFNLKIKRFRPDVPWDGPTEVNIQFKFPWNKSTPRKYLNREEWKTTRPDLDNMEKVILDSLTSEGFLVDDSIICLKTTSKKCSNTPCIIITLRQITT
jgi:Holliday junction resolvase RusA-like endonuclease